MRRRLVLAGCGGMGRRHLRGYGTLEGFEPGRLELAAVVDREIERAEFVAGEAEEILGTRPGCFTSLDEAIAAIPDLEVVDVVVAAAAHHVVVETATAAGLHVLCEKPMAPGCARLPGDADGGRTEWASVVDRGELSAGSDRAAAAGGAGRRRDW